MTSSATRLSALGNLQVLCVLGPVGGVLGPPVTLQAPVSPATSTYSGLQDPTAPQVLFSQSLVLLGQCSPTILLLLLLVVVTGICRAFCMNEELS